MKSLLACGACIVASILLLSCAPQSEAPANTGFTPPPETAPSGGGSPPGSAPAAGSLFELVNTVSVTPDDFFSGATLGYIHYVPATDHFVVMLCTHDNSETGKSVYFKEYESEPTMAATGRRERVTYSLADVTTTMVESTCYVIRDQPSDIEGRSYVGWFLERFDASGIPWKKTGEVAVPVEERTEDQKYQTGGPQVTYLGGLLDLTGEYRPQGGPPVDGQSGTHHHFLDPNSLQVLGEKIITSPPHCPELSILDFNGSYHLLAASTNMGAELLAIVFDHQWNLQRQVVLRGSAFFPTGAATDGERFFVAYIDRSNRSADGIRQDIRLAAYDGDWKQLADILVQSFDVERGLQPGGPYLLLHEGHLYVSYYMDNEKVPDNVECQVYVKVYRLF